MGNELLGVKSCEESFSCVADTCFSKVLMSDWSNF
ncbi:hypothetical protein SLEP1_g15938 [Rubroshorea leprosula]|uniref:Uncharacterized protein n=1 Tax=Rubroshorea leprosula TaxID=152421 RepID=A0AAV5IY76_9ROSI|nr:hypothetical protein SLEP1_g15938 [Rubroshorea leprosula]